MTTAALQSLAADIAMIRGALTAGELNVARAVADALAENIACQLAEREGPRRSTYGRHKLLAVLTGWAMYPPRYWLNLDLLAFEADEIIDNLKLEGYAEFNGITYYRTERSKGKHKAA